MTLDLTDDETATLAQLLRRAITGWPLPTVAAPRAPDPGEARTAETPARTSATTQSLHGTLCGQEQATRMNSYRGPPMTLGNAAAAHVRLIVWCWGCASTQLRAWPQQCRECKRQVEPDRARSRRDGRALWCRDAGPRMARSACVLRLRRTAGRFRGHRNRGSPAEL